MTRGGFDGDFEVEEEVSGCTRASCEGRLAGTTGHAGPGKVKLRTRSSDDIGKIRAVGRLAVVCMPWPSSCSSRRRPAR
jgi:hypothetical protein